MFYISIRTLLFALQNTNYKTMKKTYSYEFLRDLALYAEAQAKLWYKEFEAQEDLALATKAYEFRQELTESPAMFFEVRDNDPFEVTADDVKANIIQKYDDVFGDAYEKES